MFRPILHSPWWLLPVSAALLLSGCLDSSGSSDSERTQDTSSLALSSVTSETEFLADVKTYFRSVTTNASVYETLGVSDTMLSTAEDQGGGAAGVSTTNLVEQGVDEADLVKSDGNHLYIVDQGSYLGGFYDVCANEVCAMPLTETPTATPPIVRVMQLTNDESPNAAPLTTINVAKAAYIHGLYLTDNHQRLIVVGQSISEQPNYSVNTYIASYDVSNVENIKTDWDFVIEGDYSASRLQDDKLYLISMHNIWIDGLNLYVENTETKKSNQDLIDNLTLDDILPQTWLNDQATSVVDASDCAEPEQLNDQTIFYPQLLTVTTIPLDAPQSAKAFCTLESSGEIYVSPNAIYLAKGEYTYHGEGASYSYSTVIHKLGLTSDSVEYKASVRLPGTTGWRGNAFRMSEKDGYLRVMVSDLNENNDFTPTEHRLYTLKEATDSNLLETIAILPNENRPSAIGKPNEEIYAVRYVGDYAYVVTFQRTDPLYAINLKNPAAPYIEGELEIPGYSDYLHPIGDNLLLGVGKNSVTADDGTAWIQGVKVGLFDVSNKSNPQQIGDYSFGKRGSDADVSSDYHAFSITSDSATGSHKVAISMRIHDRNESMAELPPWDWYLWSRNTLQLFDIDDGSHSTHPAITHRGEVVSQQYAGEEFYYFYDRARSVIANDAVHFISGGNIWSANWSDPANAIGPQ